MSLSTVSASLAVHEFVFLILSLTRLFLCSPALPAAKPSSATSGGEGSARFRSSGERTDVSANVHAQAESPGLSPTVAGLVASRWMTWAA